MNWLIIGFIVLSTAGWTTALYYDKLIKEKDHEIYNKNTEIILLNAAIQQLRISKGGTDRIVYKDRVVYKYEIPKGTIDAVKLAMKVSHPDNGGNNADFIKYNELYQKITEKRR